MGRETLWSRWGGQQRRFSSASDYSYQDTTPHERRGEVISDLVYSSVSPRRIWLNPSSHILNISDIGIGNDFLLQKYKRQLEVFPFPVDVTGIDISYASLSRLVQEGHIEKAIVAGAEILPLDTNSQDLVIASEILEHTATPIVPIQDIQRILKPGGTFIGSVPNIGQLWDIIGMLRGDSPHQIKRKVYDPRFTHESHFSLRLLEEALLAGGFTDISIRTNLVRLLPQGERQIPFLSDFLSDRLPRFGDRLIWMAKKPGVEQSEVAGDYPNVYLVMGSPRTGKSTLAQAFVEQKGAHVVSISDIRYGQTNGRPQYTPQESEAAYAESVKQVAEFVKQRNNVVWDATFRSPEARARITELIRSIQAGIE